MQAIPGPGPGPEWDASPPLLFIGPSDNGQEAIWRAIRPPAGERAVHELHFPPADEAALAALVAAPPRDARGRRRVVAVFGVEAVKPCARRTLRALLDGGAFVALFTHAPSLVPEGVWSRCAVVRTPAQPSAAVDALRARDAAASLRVAALPPGPARRAALTALFQQGVTLAEFLLHLLAEAGRAGSTGPSGGDLHAAAARAQHAALGSVHAVVHAEDFLSRYAPQG